MEKTHRQPTATATTKSTEIRDWLQFVLFCFLVSFNWGY
uniref:Uncharacterized protein n=1 Tax=Rhizophora mucronata TaxID=61149 RepID=A0A2P2JBW5_RHIMU